ncbi:MAG: UbiH/UbiF/VisC/COQ6 family ubiquinone biosynthesis hydroxylase [Gammaproteobacteria bacterium]|nr:UbiH/UbiF/VisC/COQ6 family ubiquinone biosynthesis hydroxylase [Gammaproteobacteria bacterium]
MDTSNKRYDVIIVGGGMVGAAAACGLAEADLDVAVVEQHEPQREWPAEEIDLRVSAINRGSQQLLDNLGAWQGIVRRGVQPYREMRVWDNLDMGDIHFDSAAIGEADLGHIIQNRTIVAALWEQMENLANIRLYASTTVEKTLAGSDAISVMLESGEQLHAQLLIAADGSNSQIRDKAGIAVNIHDFHQSAVVATVTTANAHQETAWQHFLPTGPLAFLPVNSTQCSIVWSTIAEHAAGLIEMEDAAFCKALAEASQQRLGDITHTSARAAYPLVSKHAQTYIGSRLVLVGDAAHQIHPLAGQGVNLGFRDAALLIEVIVDARQRNRPIGSRSVLRRYERSRRGDNLVTQKSMEAINRLFSNDTPGVRQLRNLGLIITDRIAPAKALFMRQALGMEGEVPKLCKPGW